MRNHTALLANAPIFGDLDERQRNAVLARMREVRFDNNTVIFSQDEPGRDLYVLLEGRVRLSVVTSDGRELAFAHAVAGDIFGEFAVLDGGKRTASATAIGAVLLLALSRAAVSELVQTEPQFASSVIAFLCRRLRDTDAKLETMVLYPIEVRLARFLCEAARKNRDTGSTAYITLNIGISQSEIALLLGASRPKVNLALSALEETGAVRRKGNALECNLKELEAIARFDE